jgi:hypothetical protein
MTGSKEHRRDEVERAARMVLAVRLVMMTYEIVRTLVREHVLHGMGLGRLL